MVPHIIMQWNLSDFIGASSPSHELPAYETRPRMMVWCTHRGKGWAGVEELSSYLGLRQACIKMPCKCSRYWHVGTSALYVRACRPGEKVLWVSSHSCIILFDEFRNGAGGLGTVSHQSSDQDRYNKLPIYMY